MVFEDFEPTIKTGDEVFMEYDASFDTLINMLSKSEEVDSIYVIKVYDRAIDCCYRTIILPIFCVKHNKYVTMNEYVYETDPSTGACYPAFTGTTWNWDICEKSPKEILLALIKMSNKATMINSKYSQSYISNERYIITNIGLLNTSSYTKKVYITDTIPMFVGGDINRE